jgi:hypothetical protein
MDWNEGHCRANIIGMHVGLFLDIILV